MLEQFTGVEDLQNTHKLQTIGLTASEYRAAVSALFSFDSHTLSEINILAEERINSQTEPVGVVTTREQFRDPATGLYLAQRASLHQAIVDSMLMGYEAEAEPKFLVFAGPPGVGKTTLIEREGVKGVLTDPMIVQKALIPSLDEEDYDQILRTKDEAFDVAELLAENAFEKRISMVSESTLQNLPWISGALDEAIKRGYKAEITFINKPLALCFQDAIEKRKRPISLNYLLKSLKGYQNLLRHDSLEGTRVRVINKKGNSGGVLIYDDTRGNLHSNEEYGQILNEIARLKDAVIE